MDTIHEATIVAANVYGPRMVNTKYGERPVYDVKTDEDVKFAAWDKLGKAIQAAEGAKLKIEYTEREKDGFVNRTIKKASVLAANGSQSSEPAPTTHTPERAQEGLRHPTSYRNPASPDEQAAMRRHGAFNGAIALLSGSGMATGNLQDVVAVAELTEGLLDVLEGTFKVEDEMPTVTDSRPTEDDDPGEFDEIPFDPAEGELS